MTDKLQECTSIYIAWKSSELGRANLKGWSVKKERSSVYLVNWIVIWLKFFISALLVLIKDRVKLIQHWLLKVQYSFKLDYN